MYVMQPLVVNYGAVIVLVVVVLVVVGGVEPTVRSEYRMHFYATWNKS